jgi:hypothetical protein
VKVENLVDMLNDSIPELVDIDALDVLDLGGEFPKMSGNLIMSSRIIKVEGELAQQVASLWRQLKPGESARCHIPPFGLRFYFKEKLILQASICWQCDNMYIWQENNRSLYGVNLGQPSANEMLRLLKNIMR